MSKYFKWVRNDQPLLPIIDVGPIENWDEDITPKSETIYSIEITEEEARILYPDMFIIKEAKDEVV